MDGWTTSTRGTQSCKYKTKFTTRLYYTDSCAFFLLCSRDTIEMIFCHREDAKVEKKTTNKKNFCPIPMSVVASKMATARTRGGRRPGPCANTILRSFCETRPRECRRLNAVWSRYSGADAYSSVVLKFIVHFRLTRVID